jgi:hypothetical protein
MSIRGMVFFFSRYGGSRIRCSRSTGTQAAETFYAATLVLRRIAQVWAVAPPFPAAVPQVRGEVS